MINKLNLQMMKEEKLQNVGPSKIEIAFQRLGSTSHPAVFLIMGGGAQMIAWPDKFCEELVRKGVQIIRFDNRDTGLSTHFTEAPIPNFSAVLKGDYSTVSYTLSDMAADTVGLMDALNFYKVHLVGASMGGMIAQTIAIEYPSRIKSLTSIMSTTGAPNVGQPDFKLLSHLGEPPYDDRQRYIDWRLESLKAIGSPGYVFDDEAAIRTAGLSWDRDHDPLGMTRQAVAVLKSGDRTSKLQCLQTPALVIHGDSDKMVNVSGGIATAKAIPNAKLKIFKGLGHGFPKELWNEMTNLIIEHIKATD